MGWQGHLQIQYRKDGDRTTAHDLHHGPLRVLQRLYPEGDAICHHVLVHPPGGLVGGDTLEVDLDLAPDTHALITTPGATRYYRSAGSPATQSVRARVASGARLEWLPLETIAYDGCIAQNRLRFDLEPGAEMMGWDLLALGLPAAGQHWQRGSYLQHLELPGVWLERARVDASDRLLLDSPLGWAGHRVLGTMWFASKRKSAASLNERLVDTGRSTWANESGSAVTCSDEQVVVARSLGSTVEHVMQLLQRLRARWRFEAWGHDPNPPRIWKT